MFFHQTVDREQKQFVQLKQTRGAVPGFSHQGDLLRSALTVFAHQQFEGKEVIGAVLCWGRHPPFHLLCHHHLHILWSRVVHHHEAFLAE